MGPGRMSLRPVVRRIFKAYRGNFIQIYGLQSTLGWSVKTAAALQDLLYHMDFLLYVPLGLQEERHPLPVFIHLLKNIFSMVKAVQSETSEMGNVA